MITIHACVDAPRNPLRLSFSGGEIADVTQGIVLFENIDTCAVVADKERLPL